MNAANGWQRLRNRVRSAAPAPETWAAIGRTWRWVAWALILAVFLSLAQYAGGIHGLAGIAAILGLLLLASLAAWLVLTLLARAPSGVRGGLLLLVVPLIPVSLLAPKLLGSLLVLLALTLAMITAGVLRYRRQLKVSGAALLVTGAAPLAVGVAAFLVSGWQAEESPGWPALTGPAIELANPAERGPFGVRSFTYGSGNDRHREEYAEDADWLSEPVDGSALIDGWDAAVGWARTGFWGFDATALPVQGRGWMPEGDGPFPLVLMVHGNHDGTDFSDTGYGYLGESFASRGVIAVSVDENFLNSHMGDLLGGPDGGLDEESDARAWLLLEHLAQWREWSIDPDHPAFGKPDLDRVVLIGHSRGGEAVSEAVLFNRLDRYPDDGTVAFHFGFGIRGIIAIAPVDHQYHPRDRDTDLTDVNLLVIHGSHDSDVDAFAGTAMYSRLNFEHCADCFKSSFYLIGANHGQFNTSWGDNDLGFPVGHILNRDTLMDPEAQRQVAEVMFSAFLETVLLGRDEYQAFLARPETGAHWFPDGTSYLTNYFDAEMITLANFEEDADLTSGAAEVGAIRAEGLAIWKEAEVPLRWRDMDTAAVLLGWGGEDGEEPVYELKLMDGGLAVAPDMALSFGAAMGREGPEDLEDFQVPETLDFSVELVDAGGRTASVALSSRRVLYPQIDPVLYKVEALTEETASEPTFQRYVFPFSEWLAGTPDLDLASLTLIRFRFLPDTPASVWLDDVAISPRGR